MGKDKLYHLIAGFVIGMIFGLVNPFLGIVVAIGAGVGKEVYDMYIKKSFADPVDTIATVVGGMIGVASAIRLINFF